MSDRLTPETIDGLSVSVARDTEAAQLLERAASLVERGWTCGVEAEGRGRVVPPTYPAAARWCMRGAIILATQDLGFAVLLDTGDEHPELCDARPDASSVRARAFGAAAHAILGQAADPAKDLPRVVSAWNDTTCLNGGHGGAQRAPLAGAGSIPGHHLPRAGPRRGAPRGDGETTMRTWKRIPWCASAPAPRVW